MQVKLLRAIQEKSVRPVGAQAEVPVDVRLSATHKDLAALVADGRFRHDLYYRINVIELRVPPLRERGATSSSSPGIPRAWRKPGPRRRNGSRRDARCTRIRSPATCANFENVLERAVALSDGAIASACRT